MRREKERQGWDLAFFIGQTAPINGDRVAKGGHRCWIWFKGDPPKADDGRWMSGWYGSVAPLGGIRCEHHEFVPCRLPQWRVAWEEPKDLKAPPEIPEGAEWKLFPLE